MGAAQLESQARPAGSAESLPSSATSPQSRLADLARLYRVRDCLHFWPLPLAGWLATDAGLRALVGGILGWGFGLAYTAAINQAFDDRLDRLSIGKNPVGGAFRRRQAVLMSIPAAVACIAIVALLSPAGLPAAITLLILATLYSAPPRLKRIPLINTICNVAIGLPGLFFVGGIGVLDGPLRLPVGLFAHLLLVSQLIHEARDRKDDAAEGIATTATIGGMRTSLGLASFFLLFLPPLTWALASDSSMRMPLTLMAVLFAAGWIVSLVRRIGRNDETNLREVRLHYRYACLVLGAFAFAAMLF